jgi:hypothetical protein
VARYDGVGVPEDTALAVRDMFAIVNNPILASDYRLDLRLDPEIAALDEILSGDQILRGVLFSLGSAYVVHTLLNCCG